MFKFLQNIFGYTINCFFFNLSQIEFFLLWKFIFSKFKVERRLNYFINHNLRLKIRNGSYVGKRIKQFLPAKGQRTKTNGQTSKKNRISILSVKDTSLGAKTNSEKKKVKVKNKKNNNSKK